MTPTPVSEIARRLLPGGEWHPRFVRVARKIGVYGADRDDFMGDALLCIERFWCRYDPARGSEWTYTHQLMRSAASKRRQFKGGIASPTYSEFYALSDDCVEAWARLKTVPLSAPVSPSGDAEPRRLADVIPAPTVHDDRRQAAVVRAVLTAVAERSAPHRAQWIATTIALFDHSDTDLAAERGVYRQAIGRVRDRAIAHLIKSLTPAERFALSLTRSPDA